MGTSCTYVHKYHIHMCAYHVLLIQPLSSDTARSLKTSLETSSDNTDVSCLAVPCNDTSIGYNIFFIISSTSTSRHYSFHIYFKTLFLPFFALEFVCDSGEQTHHQSKPYFEKGSAQKQFPNKGRNQRSNSSDNFLFF